MNTACQFAGFGGQGVLLMGYVLSYSALSKDLNVTYFPSYGAEMRGGTANCTVTVSDEPIASPVASNPDVLIAMNGPSLEKFEDKVKENGLIIINETLIKDEIKRKDVEVLKVPLAKLAKEVGSDRAANMIMIGAVCAKAGLLSLEETITGMKNALKGKEKFFDFNQKGIERGFEFV